MGYLDKRTIIDAEDLPEEDVPVPEWAGGDQDAKVRVRGLRGAERDAFEAESVEQTGKTAKDTSINFTNFRARLVARCVIDPESGERIFNDEDIRVLGSKSAVVLDRIHDVAKRLSGMTKEDVELMTKNSEATAGESSPSTSASPSAAQEQNSSQAESAAAS